MTSVVPDVVGTVVGSWGIGGTGGMSESRPRPIIRAVGTDIEEEREWLRPREGDIDGHILPCEAMLACRCGDTDIDRARLWFSNAVAIIDAVGIGGIGGACGCLIGDCEPDRFDKSVIDTARRSRSSC